MSHTWQEKPISGRARGLPSHRHLAEAAIDSLFPLDAIQERRLPMAIVTFPGVTTGLSRALTDPATCYRPIGLSNAKAIPRLVAATPRCVSLRSRYRQKMERLCTARQPHAPCHTSPELPQFIDQEQKTPGTAKLTPVFFNGEFSLYLGQLVSWATIEFVSFPYPDDVCI